MEAPNLKCFIQKPRIYCLQCARHKFYFKTNQPAQREKDNGKPREQIRLQRIDVSTHNPHPHPRNITSQLGRSLWDSFHTTGILVSSSSGGPALDYVFLLLCGCPWPLIPLGSPPGPCPQKEGTSVAASPVVLSDCGSLRGPWKPVFVLYPSSLIRLLCWETSWAGC